MSGWSPKSFMPALDQKNGCRTSSKGSVSSSGPVADVNFVQARAWSGRAKAAPHGKRRVWSRPHAKAVGSAHLAHELVLLVDARDELRREAVVGHHLRQLLARRGAWMVVNHGEIANRLWWGGLDPQATPSQWRAVARWAWWGMALKPRPLGGDLWQWPR